MFVFDTLKRIIPEIMKVNNSLEIQNCIYDHTIDHMADGFDEVRKNSPIVLAYLCN